MKYPNSDARPRLLRALRPGAVFYKKHRQCTATTDWCEAEEDSASPGAAGLL